MDARKRTKAELEAYRALIDMRAWLHEVETDQKLRDAMPENWARIEEDFPTRPHKKQVTVRLDEDVLKWFRKMGQGYQTRINALLRMYMLARISKVAHSWKE